MRTYRITTYRNGQFHKQTTRKRIDNAILAAKRTAYDCLEANGLLDSKLAHNTMNALDGFQRGKALPLKISNYDVLLIDQTGGF